MAKIRLSHFRPSRFGDTRCPESQELRDPRLIMGSLCLGRAAEAAISVAKGCRELPCGSCGWPCARGGRPLRERESRQGLTAVTKRYDAPSAFASFCGDGTNTPGNANGRLSRASRDAGRPLGYSAHLHLLSADPITLSGRGCIRARGDRSLSLRELIPRPVATAGLNGVTHSGLPCNQRLTARDLTRDIRRRYCLPQDGQHEFALGVIVAVVRRVPPA